MKTRRLVRDHIQVGNQTYLIAPQENLTDGNGEQAFAIVDLGQAIIYFDPRWPIDVINDAVWHEVFEIMCNNSSALMSVSHDQIDLFGEKTAQVSAQIGGRFVVEVDEPKRKAPAKGKTATRKKPPKKKKTSSPTKL